MKTEWIENKAVASRGSYIPALMEKHCLNGDAYIMAEDAYDICTDGKVPRGEFAGDLAEQMKLGKVAREGSRLYLPRTLRYENAAAIRLADILRNNVVTNAVITDDLFHMGDWALCEEQCEAIRMALTHRLSIVLGDAGTGKTTIIAKLVEENPLRSFVLAAPTGKAAQNLVLKTARSARTVHSALGLRPDLDEDESPVHWEHVTHVVIDEASMLTIELLGLLLTKVRRDCCVVLVGDPNQLLSVGSGNVLPDLLRLGIPSVYLQKNFRQEDSNAALYRNVTEFGELREERDFLYDDSFRLEQMNEATAERALIEEAVRRYQAGESVQVLSPYNRKTRLSVEALNRALQKRLNPAAPEKKELVLGDMVFRDGDRVIITKNSTHCVNGDVGILRVDTVAAKNPAYHVDFGYGRTVGWGDWSGLKFMSLAYALTVHKSQGSQYDTILFPVTDQFSGMLYRNLFYTAISRAKKNVILYGGRVAVDAAIRIEAKPRRSKLVEKTQMLLFKNVG